MTTSSKDETTTTMMLAYCIEKPGDKIGKVISVPKPKISNDGNEALIKVLRAGICNTDLEILQGYMGFTGILGHEFVGVVEECCINKDLIGKRVCGDINIGCNNCNVCNGTYDTCCSKMSRNHCPNRTVLGILNKNGTMAEYITLPINNLHIVPDNISDDEATFAEPLAAACRIIEQDIVKQANNKIAILGDGKLGLMIAEVLGRQPRDDNVPKPVLFGKHQHKLDFVKDSGVEVKLISECKKDDDTIKDEYRAYYDIVIDATGSPDGLLLSAGLCRPMGTIVLKSTCAASANTFNSAPFVIDELHIIGSRCGPINNALQLLSKEKDNLNVIKYVTKTFPIQHADDAIKCAAEKSTMKVQIICNK